MRVSWGAACALAVAITYCAPACADEPIFGYIYTTDLLPKGKSEVEQWVTLREGRSRGEFHLVQTRTEFSWGIGNNFQLSEYINLAHASVNHDGPDGSTIPPEVFADYNSDPDRSFHKTRFESFSVEGIYRLASPYKSGLARRSMSSRRSGRARESSRAASSCRRTSSMIGWCSRSTPR